MSKRHISFNQSCSNLRTVSEGSFKLLSVIFDVRVTKKLGFNHHSRFSALKSLSLHNNCSSYRQTQKSDQSDVVSRVTLGLG